MSHRFQPRSTVGENLRVVARTIPWKLLFLIPILVLLAIPTYLYGARIGSYLLPSLTKAIYNAGAPPPAASPTPLPTFPTQLPQVGSVLYTVQEGDSCDSILTYSMHMNDAGQVFSDVKPETVKALDAVLGQNCHALQPGMVLPLSAHYPLIALGGVIMKIDATSPQQVVPTPLIKVPNQPQPGPDCSGGCLLTVKIAPSVQVHLQVQTTLDLHIGSWVWAQAMLARKSIRNFDNYPYVDAATPLDGMSLRACDFQVGNIHDDNSLSCDQLAPNTISDDNGAWLFGVTGPGSLDHWHYNLNVPSGTRVLLWLSSVNGNLVFKKGNTSYIYNDTSHVYIKR